MEKEDINIVKTQISERTEGEDTVPMFQIIFLEVGGRGICGGSVEGGARLCMLSVEKCSTDSHNRERGSGKDLPGGKEGACVVMAPSSTRLLFSYFFQPVLSGDTASNVKSFKGVMLLSYTLGRWKEIFQVLEAEAQQTLIMLSEGIRISKGGVVNMTKRTMPFTEPAP